MLEFKGAIIQRLAALLKPRVIAVISDGADALSEQVLAYCENADARLHLISRAAPPNLDALYDRLEERFAFHRDAALNVLHRLAGLGLIIRDGGKNWWTLRQELDLLAKAAGSSGAAFPVTFLHGVGWPTARRDQYVDPEAVPPRYRKPHRRGGLTPGALEPAEGGVGAGFFHALSEGGPQNGVLTAVEDFLAQGGNAFTFARSEAFGGLGVLYRADDFAADAAFPAAMRSLFAEGEAAELIGQLERTRVRSLIALDEARRAAVQSEGRAEALARAVEEARAREADLRRALDIAGSIAAIAKLSKREEPAAPRTAPPAPPPAAPFSETDYYRFEGERAAILPEVQAKRARGEHLNMVERELLVDRYVPPFERRPKQKQSPGREVGFLTVANDKFVPGLEAMLLSLLKVYPDFAGDIHVCHDGTLTPFIRARLRRIYDNLLFVEPDMSWFEIDEAVPGNHKRVGKLGYMNIHGLTLRGYERVILLDSDVLVLDDISPLWTNPGIVVCYDVGDREYVARSEFTGDYVMNSGVISLPLSELTEEKFEAMKAVVRGCAAPVCPILDRFADQKAWNIFLGGKEKTFLPINYNCNIRYVVKHLGGRYDGVSILHFTGPKPWDDGEFLHKSLVSEERRPAVYPRPWADAYRALVGDWRLAQFAAHGETRRKTPARAETSFRGRKLCVLIGNGPSIQRTDLSLVRDYERFCFNWFILHPDFDEIAPEHLVLASHMFFGGWNAPNPEFPPNFLRELYAKKHRPVLWTSFFFRELIEQQGLDRDFEVNYVLFEKPFKQFADKVGRFDGDIDGFLSDCRTGVLSAAIPAALSMGFETMLLVGCDGNYNQQAGNYFYDEAKHTSQQTNTSSLSATWVGEGRGQFAYELVVDRLRERGVDLFDCTLDGKLVTVPKRRLEDFARPRPAPSAQAPAREPESADAGPGG